MKHITEDDVDAINATRGITGYWDNFEEGCWDGDDDDPLLLLAAPEPLTATFSELFKLTSRGTG